MSTVSLRAYRSPPKISGKPGTEETIAVLWEIPVAKGPSLRSQKITAWRGAMILEYFFLRSTCSAFQSSFSFCDDIGVHTIDTRQNKKWISSWRGNYLLRIIRFVDKKVSQILFVQVRERDCE